MDLFLVILLLLSGIVRAFHVTTSPPELFGDEVDVGYQAVSLSKTGRDLYNQPLPTYIHSLSEWRMPALIYATVPTVTLLGSNPLAVRLPEIIFGTLGSLIFFVLVYKISRNRIISALAALSLAFLPWHIHYSRAAFESVLLLDLVMLGSLLYLKRKYVLSVIFFVLSLYTYSTALIFVPLLALCFVVLYRRIPSIISILVGLILLIPLVFNILAGPARGRIHTISVFNDESVNKKIVELRSSDNSSASRLWYNKAESYFKIILNNYLSSFSTEFLFVRGDPVMRHSFQYIGELLPISAPFLLIGFYLFAKKRHFIWLGWLFLAPLASSLTRDGGFHATRLFMMIPPLAAAIGYGLYATITFFKNHYLRYLYVSSVLAIFLVVFIIVSHYYLVEYPKDSWRWWHVGYEHAFSELKNIDSDYSRVFINNTYEPALIRFLFYTNYDPDKFHKRFTLDQPLPNIVPGYNGFTLDGKYYFGNFAKDAVYLPGSLYVLSQRENVAGDWDWRKTPPEGIKVLDTSTNPFDMPVLYTVVHKP